MTENKEINREENTEIKKEEIIFGQVIGRKIRKGEYEVWKFQTDNKKINITGIADSDRNITSIRGYWLDNDIFQVIEIFDMPKTLSEADFKAATEIMGISVTKEEIDTCLKALECEDIFQAAERINDEWETEWEIEKNLASRFRNLLLYIIDNDNMASLMKFFKDLDIRLSIANTIVIVHHLKERVGKKRGAVTELVKKYPWVLAQILENKDAANYAAEIISEQMGMSDYQKQIHRAASHAVLYVIDQLNNNGDWYVYSNILWGYLMQKGYPKDIATDAISFLQDNSNQKFGMLISDKNLMVSAAIESRFPKKELEEDYLSGKYFPEEVKEGHPFYHFSCMYLPKVHVAEKASALHLYNLMQSPDEKWDSDALLSCCDEILNEEQKLFVKTVAENKITILTGEAGTGKTKAIKGLIGATNKLLGIIPDVLGPTALSAFNASVDTVSEETGKTIHRYAKIYKSSNENLASVDADKEAAMTEFSTLVIVDEFSMLEPIVFSKLMKAVPLSAKLVFVGDPAQLPPIGAGGICTSLINLSDRGYFARINLTENYRSGEDVIMAARSVRSGNQVIQGDNVTITIATNANIEDKTIKIVKSLIEKGKDFQNSDIMVLSRRWEKDGGVNNLNEVLSKTYSKGKRIPDTKFRIGDPVVTKRNDYQKFDSPSIIRRMRPDREDVYNGMRGIIKSFDDNVVTVEYTMGNRKVERTYRPQELDYYLDLSYCMTVHKLQGSQAKNIVLVLPSDLNNRHLLYTGITRCIKGGTVNIITTSDFMNHPYMKERRKILSRFKQRVLFLDNPTKLRLA